MSEFYILDNDHNPVPVESHEEYFMWQRGREEQVRRVAKTDFPDGTYISTVFLGMNHDIFGTGAPLLFETMVFPQGKSGEGCWRYTNWDAALRGHNEAVANWVLRIES